jgi:hypothetical protein
MRALQWLLAGTVLLIAGAAVEMTGEESERGE